MCSHIYRICKTAAVQQSFLRFHVFPNIQNMQNGCGSAVFFEVSCASRYTDYVKRLRFSSVCWDFMCSQIYRICKTAAVQHVFFWFTAIPERHHMKNGCGSAKDFVVYLMVFKPTLRQPNMINTARTSATTIKHDQRNANCFQNDQTWSPQCEQQRQRSRAPQRNLYTL